MSDFLNAFGPYIIILAVFLLALAADYWQGVGR